MVDRAQPERVRSARSDVQRLLDAQRDERVLVAVAADAAAIAGDAVADAFDNAERPDRIRVSVAVPADRQPDPALDRWSDDPRVSIERVPVGQPTEDDTAGAEMAQLRRAARRRFDGEPYVLFLDGPVRFSADWDARAIEVLKLADADRPVIDLAAPAAPTAAPSRVVRRHLVDLVAPGRLCVDVAPDAEDRDGSRLAVRAYTHGYDCFAAHTLLVRTPAVSDVDHGARSGVDDRSATDTRDGLGHRRTVEAFLRLIKWREDAGSDSTVVRDC